MKKTKIILLIILCICVVTVSIFGAAVYYFTMPSDTALEASEYRLVVPSGMTIRQVGEELQDNGIIRSSLLFYLFARKNAVVLKAGIYHLSSDMNYESIYTLLASGQQEYISTSFSEGLTISKIASILESKSICKASDFIEATKDKSLLESYSIPAETFEGYLFPDTYFLNQDMNAKSVVQVMVDNFFDKISHEAAFNSLSPEELNRVVILASIVEREYRVADEAPLIASVFTNRLKRNIGLYSCATIEYIITEIQGRPHPDVILNDDLKIDSPYNTYLYAGLTPTPISNPGLIALNAAANPSKTKYYYFRLVDASSGSHHFSETFDEHIDTGRTYYTKKSVSLDGR